MQVVLYFCAATYALLIKYFSSLLMRYFTYLRYNLHNELLLNISYLRPNEQNSRNLDMICTLRANTIMPYYFLSHLFIAKRYGSQ